MTSTVMDLEGVKEVVTSSVTMGPGTWGTIHMAGLESNESGNDNDFDFFLRLVSLIAKRFKATECRQHFIEFVQSNPIKKGRAFEWSIDAHNAVNKRKGKPTITYAQAYEIWDEMNVRILPCSSSVASDEVVRSSSPPPPRGQQAIYYSVPSPSSSPAMATYMGPSALYGSITSLWNASKRR